MAINDKKMMELLADVKKRKIEIQKADRPTWKTNCSFFYPENNAIGVNLQVISNVRDLIGIASFLIDKSASYQKAAEAIGVENPDSFIWHGFSLNEWLDDIKTRVIKIQIASKRKKLETLELRLNAVMSPEMRAEIELEDIARELGN